MMNKFVLGIQKEIIKFFSGKKKNNRQFCHFISRYYALRVYMKTKQINPNNATNIA